MTLVNDIRKTVTDTTPVLALVGATDLVVEKVRAVRAQASGVQVELDVKALQGKAKQVPTQAVSKSIELAGKAEETYGDLAARGEQLVTRSASRRPPRTCSPRARSPCRRGKAAVTTVRKAADETRTAAKSTLTTAKREVPRGGAADQEGRQAHHHHGQEARHHGQEHHEGRHHQRPQDRCGGRQATEAAADKVGG